MSTLKQFNLGTKSLKAGFVFFKKHPTIIWMAILPTLIGLIVFVAMIGIFANYYGDILGWIRSIVGNLDIQDPSNFLWQILDGILWVVNLVFQLIIIIITLVLILLVGFLTSMIISAPFNDALSEKVEEIITGKPGESFNLKRLFGDLARTIKVEIQKSVLFLGIPILLLLLNLIPMIGSLLYSTFTLIFGIWDLGFTYVDYPMSRKLISFSERMKFARKNKLALMGLGWVFIIPFFNIIFTAPMTIAGTLLYLELTSTTLRND